MLEKGKTLFYEDFIFSGSPRWNRRSNEDVAQAGINYADEWLCGYGSGSK